MKDITNYYYCYNTSNITVHKYLTETTLLGWSAKDIISCPVTKFQTLHVRSENKHKMLHSV